MITNAGPLWTSKWVDFLSRLRWWFQQTQTASACLIKASSVTMRLLVFVEQQVSGSSPSSQSLPSVLPKNTEKIKAGDWSLSARLWEKRGHRNWCRKHKTMTKNRDIRMEPKWVVNDIDMFGLWLLMSMMSWCQVCSVVLLSEMLSCLKFKEFANKKTLE